MNYQAKAENYCLFLAKWEMNISQTPRSKYIFLRILTKPIVDYHSPTIFRQLKQKLVKWKFWAVSVFMVILIMWTILNTYN